MSRSDIVQFLEDVLKLGPIDTVTIWVDRFEAKEKVRTLLVPHPIDLSTRILKLIKCHAAGRGRRTIFLIEAHAGSESRGMVPVVRTPRVSAWKKREEEFSKQLEERQHYIEELHYRLGRTREIAREAGDLAARLDYRSRSTWGKA